MSAIWGQKWLKSLEDDETRESAFRRWGNICEKLSNEQISYGVDKCSLLSEFPPSISEFFAASLKIPSFAIVAAGGDGSPFYLRLMKTVDNYGMGQMSSTEANFYLRDKYNAFKERVLLDIGGLHG